MSNLDQAPAETVCGGSGLVEEPGYESLAGRDVPLGRYTVVHRFLPHRDRRMVGAWCFVDHFGPDGVAGRPGLRVPPHPHTGLQTVSWLVAGEVLHRDSLGNVQTIRPGQLNLMTSGHGIAHSEESPTQRPPTLHGVQLWVALPEDVREGASRFEHHAGLPVQRDEGVAVTVIVGDVAGARSDAVVHSPLVGAEVALDAGADVRLPLEPDFEHAVLLLNGAAEVDGRTLPPETMVYLGRGRRDLGVQAAPAVPSGPGEPTRVLLLGGVPFTEQLVMWWNFVGRTHEDIARAREDWTAERRFGVVHGYDGDPLPAPPLPVTRLLPRGRLGRSGTG
ncbi:MAG: pirin family protein [Actinomycetes bacterium]